MTAVVGFDELSDCDDGAGVIKERFDVKPLTRCCLSIQAMLSG